MPKKPKKKRHAQFVVISANRLRALKLGLKQINQDNTFLRNQKDQLLEDRRKYRAFVTRELVLQNNCKDNEYYTPKAVCERLAGLLASVEGFDW